jgi:hypothetical protein
MTGLRTQFRIKKKMVAVPSVAEIVVTNLAEATRHKMRQKGGKVVLTAGYKNNSAVIFSGSARTIDHMHTDADWNTVIKSGDGETDYQFGWATISIKGVVPFTTAAMALANATGLGLGNLQQTLSTWQADFKQWNHGYHYHGPASKGLSQVLGTIGLHWYIENGQIMVLPPNTTTNQQAFYLSQDSGLLGSPEHGSPDQRGIKSSIVKAKCLLIPQLKAGRRVHLKTRSFEGDMLLVQIEHVGDSMGTDWFSHLELRTIGSPYITG